MEKKKKMKKGKVRVPTSKVGFSKGAEVVSGRLDSRPIQLQLPTALPDRL